LGTNDLAIHFGSILSSPAVNHANGNYRAVLFQRTKIAITTRAIIRDALSEATGPALLFLFAHFIIANRNHCHGTTSFEFSSLGLVARKEKGNCSKP